jgi:hypothetical protein
VQEFRDCVKSKERDTYETYRNCGSRKDMKKKEKENQKELCKNHC